MKRATATALAAGTQDAQGVAAATHLRLLGFSVRESGGSTAAAVLRRGTVDTAPPLAFVALGSDEVQTVWFGDGGIDVDAGVFVERESGSTEWVFYTRKGP